MQTTLRNVTPRGPAARRFFPSPEPPNAPDRGPATKPLSQAFENGARAPPEKSLFLPVGGPGERAASQRFFFFPSPLPFPPLSSPAPGTGARIFAYDNAWQEQGNHRPFLPYSLAPGFPWRIAHGWALLTFQPCPGSHTAATYHIDRPPFQPRFIPSSSATI